MLIIIRPLLLRKLQGFLQSRWRRKLHPNMYFTNISWSPTHFITWGIQYILFVFIYIWTLENFQRKMSSSTMFTEKKMSSVTFQLYVTQLIGSNWSRNEERKISRTRQVSHRFTTFLPFLSAHYSFYIRHKTQI